MKPGSATTWPSRCRNCGYSLESLKPEERCPECAYLVADSLVPTTLERIPLPRLTSYTWGAALFVTSSVLWMISTWFRLVGTVSVQSGLAIEAVNFCSDCLNWLSYFTGGGLLCLLMLSGDYSHSKGRMVNGLRIAAGVSFGMQFVWYALASYRLAEFGITVQAISFGSVLMENLLQEALPHAAYLVIEIAVLWRLGTIARDIRWRHAAWLCPLAMIFCFLATLASIMVVPERMVPPVSISGTLYSLSFIIGLLPVAKVVLASVVTHRLFVMLRDRSR